MGYFAGYDINTNPGAANSFATAAFQFITSLLPGSIQYFDQVCRVFEALNNVLNLLRAAYNNKRLEGLETIYSFALVCASFTMLDWIEPKATPACRRI